MLNTRILEDIVYGFLREARIRYGESWVERIKLSSSKATLYMVVGGERVKAIIYRDKVKVRVYSRLKGLCIAVQRILEREYIKALKRWEREGEESI